MLSVGIALLIVQVGISAGTPAGFLMTKRGSTASDTKVHGLSARVMPKVKVQASIHERDDALKSSMRSMMQDDDADDDVWYGKPKNGLIQTSGTSGTGLSLDDVYMQESTKDLSAALGPRWDSKVIEANADRTTKAFLNGISSPKALGSLHAMMGTMAALR